MQAAAIQNHSLTGPEFPQQIIDSGFDRHGLARLVEAGEPFHSSFWEKYGHSLIVHLLQKLYPAVVTFAG